MCHGRGCCSSVASEEHQIEVSHNQQSAWTSSWDISKVLLKTIEEMKVENSLVKERLDRREMMFSWYYLDFCRLLLINLSIFFQFFLLYFFVCLSVFLFLSWLYHLCLLAYLMKILFCFFPIYSLRFIFVVLIDDKGGENVFKGKNRNWFWYTYILE